MKIKEKRSEAYTSHTMVSEMIDFEYNLNTTNTCYLDDDEILSMIYGLFYDDNAFIEEIKIKGKYVKEINSWKERIEG
jgi:hypothetical protein